MQVELFLDQEEKTIELGKIIGEQLSAPALLYLEGDLGTGKTHFSKGIARGLGITEDITSPTFTLINEYHHNELKLYHLDLYRLDNLNQVLDLGIEDFIDEPGSIVLMEWAEKLENYKLSADILEVKIFHEGAGRRFLITSDSDKYKKIIEKIENREN